VEEEGEAAVPGEIRGWELWRVKLPPIFGSDPNFGDVGRPRLLFFF